MVVLDGNRLFGDALAAVLERRGHQVVESGTRPEDALRAVQEHDVDVIVVEIAFPKWAGLDAIQSITETSPTTDVVVLTEGVDRSLTEKALAVGARVCVDKRSRLEVVVDAIESDGVNGHVTTGASAATATDQWSKGSLGRFLTPREREALEGLAAGESTAGLAARLGVSAATARTHVQNVLSKLGVHSRLEAVIFAVENGLVTMSEVTMTERTA